jgi:hypothetical protein
MYTKFCLEKPHKKLLAGHGYRYEDNNQMAIKE